MHVPTARPVAGTLDGSAALRRSARGLAVACLVVAGGAGAASAQLIPVRTVPVSQDHQFRIFPSLTSSMGGVSIAVADSLLDPFTNPAKGARVQDPYFLSSPASYSVSSEAGGGRTLPLGALTREGPWYGGFVFALQEVDLSERTSTQPPVFAVDCVSGCAPRSDVLGPELPPDERTLGNRYAFAMVGREIPSAGLSLGASVLWSGLDAVDGVDLLYAGSARIRQEGQAVDVRVGMLKEWEGERTLEALVLYNRFGMSHDVYYLDRFWDPGTAQMAQRSRVEQNLDRTRAWGLHVEYERPLAAEGWRVGWLGTVNYKSHPKIPNYEIMNIPRDPGRSAAFNLGIGLARTRGTFSFGVDAVYEPIWSYTWADAAGPVETRLGKVIPNGGKTIENRFRFANALFRMGIADEIELEPDGSTTLGLQLGLRARRIDYRLEQTDNVEVSERDLTEDWVEWTPTWGVGLRRAYWEIRYQGSVTHGTGRPGVAGAGAGNFQCNFGACPTERTLSADAGGSNVLLAPSGPLTLDPVRVVAHQVALSLSIR